MFGGFRLELQYESVMYQFHQDDVQCIHEVRKLLHNWQSVDSSESLMQKLQIESYSLGEPSIYLFWGILSRRGEGGAWPNPKFVKSKPYETVILFQ